MCMQGMKMFLCVCGKGSIIKMNAKQNNNVINHTLKYEAAAQTQDSLATARVIFNNMGVALPTGNMKEVCETIKTDNYMGWKSCTMQEAKEAADQGIAAIGISENRVVVLAATDVEETVAETAGVLTFSENTSAYAVSDLSYYAYTYGATGGCGSTVVTGNYNDRYTYELVHTFGFSDTVAKLIRSLYEKVDDKFSSEDELVRAWKCARLLSVFVYDGLAWDNVAASVVSLEKAQDYFTGTLGYTVLEYTSMKKTIKTQHDDTLTPDFAHMQYALAARLAYKLSKEGYSFPLGFINIDEDVSYMGGWLGDAVLIENGTTSLKDDDYCADLDAENIYRAIVNRKNSINAINTYYGGLTVCNNRAHKFLSYISYATIQKKVFDYLIDMNLTVLRNSAIQNGDINAANYYLTLINDEQYHFDEIKKKYSDTYNFLFSLKNRKAYIEKY